jgi:hypothetical protein
MGVRIQECVCVRVRVYVGDGVILTSASGRSTKLVGCVCGCDYFIFECAMICQASQTVD